MKRKTTLLFLLSAIALNGCAQKQQKELIVAFYNCENFFDTLHEDGKNDYEFTPQGTFHYTQRIYLQKLHNIATVIQHMPCGGPAVMGMAEVENDHVLNDLVHQPEISGKHYKYVWYNGPDERGINVALLYNPALFTVISSKPLHVGLQGTGAKETTRDVLYVCGILSGDTVNILVNHWPSRRGAEGESAAKRAIAAGVDKRVADSLTAINARSKIIITGDMNDNPGDSSVANVLGAAGDKNSITGDKLYNPWADIYGGGQGTLVYKHEWYLFDQIIVSGVFLHPAHKLYYERAEIYKPDFLVDHYKRYDGQPHRSFAGTHWINGYSDHFPVIMYLGKR